MNDAAPAPTPKLDMALVLAFNAVPLWGVLAGDWSIGALMVLFWLENVFAGLFQAARMLALPGPTLLHAMKFVLVPFFVVHYGGFATVHGIFVFTMMVPEGLDVTAEPGFHLAVLAALVLQGWQAWQAQRGYVAPPITEEQRQAGHRDAEVARAQMRPLLQLMMEPYLRVGILHVVIVLGGVASLLMGTPLASLVMLVLLKTALELAQVKGVVRRWVARAH